MTPPPRRLRGRLRCLAPTNRQVPRDSPRGRQVHALPSPPSSSGPEDLREVLRGKRQDAGEAHIRSAGPRAVRADFSGSPSLLLGGVAIVAQVTAVGMVNLFAAIDRRRGRVRIMPPGRIQRSWRCSPPGSRPRGGRGPLPGCRRAPRRTSRPRARGRVRPRTGRDPDAGGRTL